jgi:hypothetical protein
MADSRTDIALRLCRSLSGFDDISPRFAGAALADLEHRAGPEATDRLLKRFQDDGIETLVGDAAMQPHVRGLLIFLYTGFGRDGQPSDTPENHFESLMWRAALAHPPALSGGYFGHWSYPPDEANA